MRSINFTLRLQVRYYLRSYSDGIGDSFTLEDIVDNIHFYWFRNSLEREYKWTKDLDTIMYIENNSSQMKMKIKELAISELGRNKNYKFRNMNRGINQLGRFKNRRINSLGSNNKIERIKFKKNKERVLKSLQNKGIDGFAQVTLEDLKYIIC